MNGHFLVAFFVAVHIQTIPFVDMWLAQRSSCNCLGQLLSIGFLVIGLWQVLTIIHPWAPTSIFCFFFLGIGNLGRWWDVGTLWRFDMAANPQEMANANY